MIVLKRIQVQNYKTIGKADLMFEPGIYKVVGKNNDTRYTSNGAGKTTILQALAVGLYNRDISGVSIDQLSNRTTGKPFRIEVDLMAGLRNVKVINDRGDAKKMFVYIDGELKCSGVTNSLALIESTLGMGYDTFRLTHYITGTTISHLTQNLSQPTLFNDILHVIELQDLDKRLMSINKDIQLSLQEASATLRTLREQKKVLELSLKYNQEDLRAALESAQEELEDVEDAFSNTTVNLKAEISNYKTTVDNLELTLLNLKKSIKNGMCSQCGSILSDISSLSNQLIINEGLLSTASETLRVLNKKYYELDSRYQEIHQGLNASVISLSQDLGIAVEVSGLSSEINHTPMSEAEEAHRLLEAESTFVATARKEIKSGRVVKDTLDKFFQVVQAKIGQYQQLINLEQFGITVANDKLGMGITLTSVGKTIPVDSLSNGEKTRLSLLVLISMLDAMKVVTDADSNYLVIDEASSSFDKSGIQELEKLFSYLKGLGHSVFVITHGSEMDAVPYDKVLTVTKDGGVSTIHIEEA